MNALNRSIPKLIWKSVCTDIISRFPLAKYWIDGLFYEPQSHPGDSSISKLIDISLTEWDKYCNFATHINYLHYCTWYSFDILIYISIMIWYLVSNYYTYCRNILFIFSTYQINKRMPLNLRQIYIFILCLFFTFCYVIQDSGVLVSFFYFLWAFSFNPFKK